METNKKDKSYMSNDVVINSDKFHTHKGEFVPIEKAILHNKIIIKYNEFVDEIPENQ